MTQPSTTMEIVTNTLANSLAVRFADILEYNGEDHAALNVDILFEPNATALRMRGESVNKTRSDVVNTNYPLEFINFWLDRVSFPETRQRPGLGLNGVFSSEAATATKQPQVTAVPVTLDYYVTFWTKTLNKMEIFLSLARFWPFDTPTLSAVYLSGLTGDSDTEYTLEFPMIIGTDIDDLSSYEDRFQKGKYWAKSFKIRVESWFLQSGSVYYCKEIRSKVYQSFVVSPSTLVWSETITE